MPNTPAWVTLLDSDPDVVRVDIARTHRFRPPLDVARPIPALYATEDTPLDDKVVHVHYFVGAADWYVTEIGDDGRAFGYADLGHGFGEWGYIDLCELGSMFGGPGMPVERDLHWKAAPFGTVMAARPR